MLNSLSDRWFAFRERKQLELWHEVLGVYVFVFVVWGLYRLLSPLPLWIEEVILKGLVFGGPVFWVAMRSHGWSLKDLGITSEGLFRSVYLGLGLGVVLGLVGQVGNVVRHGGLNLSSHGVTSEEVGGFLLLALVTAFWEGLLFYGYILNRLKRSMSERRAVVATTLMYVVIHIPALVLAEQMAGTEVVLALLLLSLLGAGNSVLMLRMKNLAAPILAQAVWGVSVFLFR